MTPSSEEIIFFWKGRDLQRK